MLGAQQAKIKFLKGVVAMKKFLMASTIAVLAGCVSIPTVQNFGSGRFLQFNARGAVYLQMDTVSPETCAAEAARAKPNPGQEVVCSTVSLEKLLPYSFEMQNVITSEVTLFRLKSSDGCQLMNMTLQKDQKDALSAGYKYSGCKLT